MMGRFRGMVCLDYAGTVAKRNGIPLKSGKLVERQEEDRE
jgi:hypothetical protein